MFPDSVSCDYDKTQYIYCSTMQWPKHIIKKNVLLVFYITYKTLSPCKLSNTKKAVSTTDLNIQCLKWLRIPDTLFI